MYKVLATLYALFLLFMYIYMKNWLFLGIAIACEVIATSNLKLSEGFTKWLPSTLVVVGYAAAFYFLSLTLKTVPVGVAYSVWSGLGIVAISIVAWFAFGQKPDLWGVVGMGLIIAGVVVLNTLSNTTAH